GNVTADGGAAVTERGIEYSISEGFVLGEGAQIEAAEAGTGEFTVEVTELTASTTYYHRAYATNNEGTAYGDEQSFTTFTGELITAEDIPEDNTGPFSKTIDEVPFNFTPAANNYVELISHMGSFYGLYAWNSDTESGTEMTISAPGHSFDVGDFKYISDAGTVELAITLTFADGTSDTKSYTLTGDITIKTFTTYSTVANDIVSIKLVSDAFITYNDFVITDVKPLPGAATPMVYTPVAETSTVPADDAIQIVNTPVGGMEKAALRFELDEGTIAEAVLTFYAGNYWHAAHQLKIGRA